MTISSESSLRSLRKSLKNGDHKVNRKIKRRDGLNSPSRFINLPNALKLKILEYLPGPDIAKLECVSSQILDLSLRSRDLWKDKYMELKNVLPSADKKIELNNSCYWNKMFVDLHTKRRVSQRQQKQQGSKRVKKMKLAPRKRPRAIVKKRITKECRPSCCMHPAGYEYSRYGDFYGPSHLVRFIEKEMREENILSANYVLSRRALVEKAI